MRPAEHLVRTASRFESEITLVKDTVPVNGKSIMGVMMLAAEYGSSITIEIEGPDDGCAEGHNRDVRPGPGDLK